MVWEQLKVAIKTTANNIFLIMLNLIIVEFIRLWRVHPSQQAAAEFLICQSEPALSADRPVED